MELSLTASRRKNLRKYVIPAVAGMCSTFLYIVVDGIFVGQGIGMDALGAVNIALPFILLTSALCTLMTIGGVTITAIRLGRGDKSGANDAFRHATALAFFASVLLMAAGMVFPREIAVLCGANSTFLEMSAEYIFYCSLFSLPMGLGFILQGFVRNDGSPALVAAAVILAVILAVCRCIVVNSLSILLLPRIAGPAVIWYTVGIAELASFFAAVILLKYSERNGVVFR
jgi:Na+-driven multidrug efflux pump